MTRRLFGLMFGALLIGAPVALGQPAGSPPAIRPNIVLLVLDDQDAFSPFWEAMPQTAALIRDRGVTFNRAFAPTPICTPGRVSILSGQLAHNTGVFTLTGPSGVSNYFGDAVRAFPVFLTELGYYNAFIGKTWRGGGGADPGWHAWWAFGGDNMHAGYDYFVVEQFLGQRARSYPGGQYSTDWMADRAEALLEVLGGAPVPFCLMLNPIAPHLPLPPARRHERFARAVWGNRMPRSPNFNEQDVSEKPSWLRLSAGTRSGAVPYANAEYYKRMGSLIAVDEMMGRIGRVLASQGRLENTVFIITSDNGYNLGAHRLIHKMAPYEESIRVPLVISGPGIASNTEIDRIVGIHDLAPTLIELAGGTAPEFMDGKSLVPFLREGENDASPTWRNALVTEYNTGGVRPGHNPGGSIGPGYNLDIPTYRSIRTDSFKYVFWPQTGEEELYLLDWDPYELYNLMALDPVNFGVLRDILRFQMIVQLSGAGPTSP